MSHSFAVKLWLFSLGLFLFIGVGFADGDIGVTPFFLETAAEVIVAAVYGVRARQKQPIRAQLKSPI